MSYKYDPVVGHKAVSSAAAEGAAPFMGPVDITETPEAFVFVTDCPGLSSKDVHVRVTHNLLQLSGERESTKESDDNHVHRLERTSGKFCRTFRLPSGCDIHNVKAMCEHGVLTVTVAKDEDTRKEALLKNDMLSLSEGDGSLNEEFKKVPMSVFPTPKLGKIVTLRSDDSILQAVRTLSEHHILSAPVIDVNAPADAGWTEKYIGMVDMVGIVFHMLEKLDTTAPEDFSAEIEKVDAFRHTTVADAVNFAGFGPFVPVDVDYSTLLDCMLLCGAHAFRRLPVVKTPAGDIVNIITQSALVQTLEANLERFKSVGSKTLSELDLGRKGGVLLVKEDQPLKDAFKLIHDNDISAVPVVNDKGAIVGNVSARDARLIVSSKKIYKLLNMPISTYLSVVTDGAENSAITCKPSDTLESVIRTLVASRIHRVYVVDDENKPLRVVSLRNVLTKFVKEEPGYFGHFFN